MTARKLRACRQCKASLYRFETNGTGRVVGVFAPCLCERKRLAGICLDCDLPVAGARGKSVRCEGHTTAARRAAIRRYYRKQKAAKGTSYIHPATKRSHRRAAYLKRQCERARQKMEQIKRDPEKLARHRAYRHTFSKYGHPNREKKLAYMREYNRKPEVIARKAAQKRRAAA